MIAAIYWLNNVYGFNAMYYFLLTITAVSLCTDSILAKMKIELPVYKQLQRKHEKHGIHHHTLALVSILILLKLTTPSITAASAGMLVYGDAAAAVVGKLFGKHKIFQSKTWEGTIAMLVVSIFAGSIVLGTNKLSITMALAATIAEAFSTKISDAITVPFAAGIISKL